MNHEQIVAVAMLTDSDLARIGHAFRTIYRADDAAQFDDLLKAIDRGDRTGPTNLEARS